MLARLLPLVVLLSLSACSGARVAPAEDSAETVWAELVALAVAPDPDLDAVAARSVQLSDDVPVAFAPEEALAKLHQLMPGATAGRVDYTIVSRRVYTGTAGAFTALRIQYEREPRYTVNATFVRLPGQPRPAFLL